MFFLHFVINIINYSTYVLLKSLVLSVKRNNKEDRPKYRKIIKECEGIRKYFTNNKVKRNTNICFALYGLAKNKDEIKLKKIIRGKKGKKDNVAKNK